MKGPRSTALLTMLFLLCLYAWLTLEEQPTQGWAIFSEVFGGGAAPELQPWVRVGLNQEREVFHFNLHVTQPRDGEGRRGQAWLIPLTLGRRPAPKCTASLPAPRRSMSLQPQGIEPTVWRVSVWLPLSHDLHIFTFSSCRLDACLGPMAPGPTSGLLQQRRQQTLMPPASQAHFS